MLLVEVVCENLSIVMNMFIKVTKIKVMLFVYIYLIIDIEGMVSLVMIYRVKINN